MYVLKTIKRSRFHQSLYTTTIDCPEIYSCYEIKRTFEHSVCFPFLDNLFRSRASYAFYGCKSEKNFAFLVYHEVQIGLIHIRT